MAGIYIHIPFCKQACVYCNFHFSTSMKLKNDFLNALLKEIDIRKEYLQGESIETIYFGGGTPSILRPGEIQSILERLRQNFSINDGVEITLEANPDDIDKEKPLHWQQLGINRLSLGVQSFFDEDLKWMNRAHVADQSLRSIEQVKNAGFTNLTIDLIYGTPSLTDEKWKQNVERCFQFDIPHLSCYALTVEPKTALDALIRKKEIHEVNADDQSRQFDLLIQWTEENGYEHYEISNFCKPGMRSRHNTSYWQQKKYLGLGPSAHSFNGSSRQWNIGNNALYISSLQNGFPSFELENLSSVQRINEYIMTSLRTKEGLDLQYITREFGEKAVAYIETHLPKHRANESLFKEGNSIRLTRKGKHFADGIAADLFFDHV